MATVSTEALLGRRPKGMLRELVTPEGVPLHLELASISDRFSAFTIDCLVIIASLVALVMLTVFGAMGAMQIGTGPGFVGAFFVVGFFLLQNFYWVWFELHWQGTTPGKRYMNLRVIDASGGRLTGDAVFARNLTRNVEIYIPATALLNPSGLFPDAPGWAVLCCLVWLLLIAGLPHFNRDNLRAGDLIAGTMVVYTPQPTLLRDLTRRSTEERRAAVVDDEPAYQFSDQQLGMYGIYELQVLEDVLRQTGRERVQTLQVVSLKIRRKIAWESDGPVDHEQFLKDFYAASRARLEQQMVMGERQERKRKGRLRRKTD